MKYVQERGWGGAAYRDLSLKLETIDITIDVQPEVYKANTCSWVKNPSNCYRRTVFTVYNAYMNVSLAICIV